MSIIDGIGMFFDYLIFHALPPIVVAAALGAAAGWLIAQMRMSIERRHPG